MVHGVSTLEGIPDGVWFRNGVCVEKKLFTNSTVHTVFKR